MNGHRLQALREACRRTSQKAVGDRLRGAGSYPSTSIINQVLQGKYTGDNEKFWRLVDGAYLGVSVSCPVLGKLPLDECIQSQSLPFESFNPIRVALSRECRSCPNALKTTEDAA